MGKELMAVSKKGHPGWVKQSVGYVTVKLIADDRVGIAISRDGIFEPQSMEVWRAACADGRAQTAIDVGAHGGLFAISAALMGNYSIAIEAKPELVERIKANAQQNRAEVTVMPVAAASFDGKATLHMNGCALSCASSLLHRADKHNRSIMVDAMRLDTVKVKGRVGIIKIDVEGTEADVIHGAQAILEKYRPVLLIETLENHERKSQIQAALPNYDCVGFLDGRNMHMVPR